MHGLSAMGGLNHGWTIFAVNAQSWCNLSWRLGDGKIKPIDYLVLPITPQRQWMVSFMVGTFLILLDDE